MLIRGTNLNKKRNLVVTVSEMIIITIIVIIIINIYWRLKRFQTLLSSSERNLFL